MAVTGLRERKKLQTRQAIARSAATLFAQRGYERVAVLDVARAANVSEQTVYNYFPTKERLVLDRDEEFELRLAGLVRERPPGASPAGALRAEALALLDGMESIPARDARGGLAYIAAVSPAVRRLCLEMTDRHADAIAQAIVETSGGSEGEGEGEGGCNRQLAKVQAVALAWVFQAIIDHAGRALLTGQAPAQIAAALRPEIERTFDSLDSWLQDAS
ncbi:MAG: TetR/AcrR family transcriptional regulator [Solirubrobacteraceae bacterium]